MKKIESTWICRQIYPVSQLQGSSTDREVDRQQSLFESLQDRLGEASSSNIDTLLADRVVVDCEPELTPEMIDRLRAKITAAK